MNIFKEKYYQVKLSKKEIELAYEKAQSELDSGEYSKGLMAKAKANYKGKYDQIESKYLDYRTEQILNEKIKEQNKYNHNLLGKEAKKKYNQALDNYRIGNFKLAIEHLNKANKIQPNNATILIGLAYNYSKIQDFQKAIIYMELAVSSGYNNFERIQNHEDFKELRKTDIFQEFVKNGYKQKK